MKKFLVLFPVVCSRLFAAYSYYYTDTLTSINASNWIQNGTLTATSGGLTSSNSNGGSLISKVAVPDGSSNYEVKTTITLTQSGGTYVSYLRASSNALSGPAVAGTAYAFEMQNPTLGPQGYLANFVVYKIINGSMTPMSNFPFTCQPTATLRVVYTAIANQIAFYVDNTFVLRTSDGSISSGQPGIGVRGAPSGNTISEVQLGGIYTGAPTVPATSDSAFSNRVDLQWPAASEPNGPGVAIYQLERNSTFIGYATELAFSDANVASSTSYTYLVGALDFHMNVSWDTLPVSTPAAGNIDAREIGIRPTGSYWGGGGEQIDMLSGNLNYTAPMIKAMGRGGWGIGFNLTYSAQNWRKDSGGTWQLGQDVGYGYGWKFLVGSLLPLLAPGGAAGSYLFTDSTGAQYHLNQNSGSLWTSTESTYVTYDASAEILHFNDGSFWVMGCTSAYTEWDAGTMYPTTIEDSNGNQITINYEDGIGVDWAASSRISTIKDVRGNGVHDYTFTYNSDAIPHLTGITNTIGTSENYSFTYTENYSLKDPFAAGSFGTATLLASSEVTGIPLYTYFTYDTASATTSCGSVGTGTSGPGQLTQVTTPYCGHLRWTYTTADTLLGSRSYNEIQNRFLSMSTGAAETEISLVRGNDSSYVVHSSATLQDSPANAEKSWTFQTSTSSTYLGLVSSYEELTLSTGTGLSLLNYTWAQTPTTLNPYIGTTVTKLNPGQTYEADKQTVQTLDQYGNVLTQQIYNFGAAGGGVGALARTYTNTYLGGSNYTSRYIFNRLLTSTVTDGTYTTTLASTGYDQNGLSSVTPNCINPSHVCEHDDTNYPTTFNYRGNLTSSVTPTASTSTNFDMTGNVTSTTTNGVTSSVTQTSTYNYAAPSQVTTNSLNSSMNWSSFLGMSSATDPNGDTGSINYDANARPSQTTSPYGAVSYFTYNDTASPPNKLGMTNGHGSKSVMDGFGRTIQTVTGSGSSSSITTITSTVDAQYAPCGCSPLGKLFRQSQPYAPGGTDAWTTYTYDASGRTLTVTLPDGSATSYLYQGNTVKVTDPAGKYKTFTMDALGNLTQVQEPDPSLGTVTSTYTYDILNHLTSDSMPRGSSGTQTRTFNYVSGSTVTAFLQSAINPENGTVSYTYNAGTNTLASKTDAKGQKLTYQYDNYNRLTSVTWANKTGGPQVLRTYYYDTNPLQSGFSLNALGRLTVIQYPAQSYTNSMYGTQNGSQVNEMYSYTAHGTAGAGLPGAKRMQVSQSYTYTNTHGTQTTVPLAANLDTTLAYNNEGKISSITYPSTISGTTTTPGPSYNYSYDSMYRLSGMTSGSATVVSGVTYNAANQMLTGVDIRTYNVLGQVTSIGNGWPENLTYNYPTGTNNGKVSSMYNAISGETVTYTYDSLNRLATASGSGWGEQYGFDPFGNLLSKTVTAGSGPSMSLTANPANNQIGGLSYDANGNAGTSLIGGTSVAYDAENRISSSGAFSNTMYYAYDGQNHRIWSWNGGQDAYGDPTNYTVNAYSPGGQKLGAYTFSVGLLGESYVPTMQVALASSDKYFGARRLAVMDQLGSAYAADGGQSYFPWGEPRTSDNPQDTWNFATYWADSATGLDYANNRYYSNAYGRFMTPDPNRASASPKDPRTWNRYAYTGGDPVNFVDPSGTAFIWAPLPDNGGGSGGGDDEFDNIGNGFQNTSGYCDPSQGPGACPPGPCVAGDGTPMPGPGCPAVGGPPPPAPPPGTSSLEVPTSLELLGFNTVPCSQSPNGPVGILVNVTYQVLDQWGQPLDEAGLLPLENLTGSTQNFNKGATGPSTPNTYTRLGPPTNASGIFVDPGVGVCATGAGSAVDIITQRIILGSVSSTVFFGTPIAFYTYTVSISSTGPESIVGSNGVSVTIPTSQ